MNWDNEATLNFIKEYEKHPILWNKSHKLYFNVVKEEDAWREVSVIFSEEIDVLKKKIDSLRGSRRREKNRISKSMGTGKGRKDIYVSKWFAWESMKFLEDPEEIRPTTSNVNTSESEAGDDHDDDENFKQKEDACIDRDSEEDLVEDFNDDSNSSVDISRQRSRKKRFISPKKPAPKRRGSEDPRIQEAFEILKNKSATHEKKDDCSIFGNYVTEKMRKLDDQTRTILQHQIHNLIFQVEMGRHTRPMQPQPQIQMPFEYSRSPSHSPSPHHFSPSSSSASSYTGSPLPSPQDKDQLQQQQQQQQQQQHQQQQQNVDSNHLTEYFSSFSTL